MVIINWNAQILVVHTSFSGDRKMVENIFRQKQWKIFSIKNAGKYFPVEKVFHRADEFSLSQYIFRSSEFSPSFLFITDLSEYWNSALFPTIVVISLLIVADIFISVFYMGESARQRRRLYSLRNYYRRRNFGAPKTRHGHHHHHAIGRMGYSEEAAENPDEYQRSE